MTDDLNDALADAAEEVRAQVPTDQGLTDLRDLVAELLLAQAEVERCEDQLGDAKEKLRQYVEKRVPEKMAQLGVEKQTLTGGVELSVKPFISASLPNQDDNPEAYEQALDWLRANGLADIIKRTVSAQFGRGEDEQAQHLLDRMQEDGLVALSKVKVEASTLKASLREHLQRGGIIQCDAIKLYTGNAAKVGLPKGVDAAEAVRRLLKS